MGNLVSTFTMPAAVARDVVGQFDYEQAGAPVVRDLDIEERVKGESEVGDVLGMQAIRMLPDVRSIQYAQSFNGETDIGYYRFSNPGAIGKVSPLTKQITGAVSEPTLTGLEEEMNKANLKDWQLYNKSTAPNANVDYVLRHRLAKTMYKDFEAWRKGSKNKRGVVTYDETSDPKEKAKLLEDWIKNRIGDEREIVEDMLEQWAISKPYSSRGFIRNTYALKQKEVGKDAFDDAAKALGYESSKSMIADSESVKEEVKRRRLLLAKINDYIPNEAD